MATKRNTITNLKLNIGNENLYLDIDELLNNVDMLTLTEDDIDDTLGIISLNKLPVSSKIAINTLIKYNIIKKL